VFLGFLWINRIILVYYSQSGAPGDFVFFVFFVTFALPTVKLHCKVQVHAIGIVNRPTVKGKAERGLCISKPRKGEVLRPMVAAPHWVAPRSERGAHHCVHHECMAVMHANKAPRPHRRGASSCCMMPIGHAACLGCCVPPWAQQLLGDAPRQ